MFRGLVGEFGIERPALKLSTVEGRTLKTIRLALSHDFDNGLAALLGKAGGQALAALEARDFEQATMPIDGIKAIAKMQSADRVDSVEVPAFYGLKAVGKPGASDAEPPTLSLSFECMFDPAAWAFFGKHAGSAVWVDLTPIQTELALEAPPRIPRAPRVRTPSGPTATTIAPGGEPAEVSP